MSAAAPGNASNFAARPLSSGGTPVAAWLVGGRPARSLDLAECPGLILVAPHPDDETLGFGAAAAALGARGVPVQVVSVSDGGRAYPDLTRQETLWLERDRRAEVVLATRALGLTPPIHLGLPDGELAAHESELERFLVETLEAAAPGSWCAATWSGDGHPDHEAVGRAATAAAARVGTVAIEYPVWMWHWAQPGDECVPWHRMVAVPVDEAALTRKRNALRVFRSQLGPYGLGAEPALPSFVVSRISSIGEVAFR